MNNEQARIVAYLEMAADQFLTDGAVDVALQANLEAAGYELDALEDDIQTILLNR